MRIVWGHGMEVFSEFMMIEKGVYYKRNTVINTLNDAVIDDQVRLGTPVYC